MENDSKDAMDFRTFCKRNSISLSFLYELLKTGNALRLSPSADGV